MHDDITIEARNLKKYFETSKGMLHAVDDVSFSIRDGKTLGVVGESGCGKSTLGRAVLGLITPTAGEVIYRGTDVTKIKGAAKKKLKKEMQIIFQDPFSSLNPRMSVHDLIAEPLLACDICSKKQLNEHVKELMDVVGLAQRFVNAYPHELDGGRRQRIGVARALSVNPKFIVCDEPVSALDVSIQAQILNLLQDLQYQRNLSYMFITHDLSVVKHISDEILVMYLGCPVETCSTKELFQNPLHPYTKGLLTAIPIPNIHVQRQRILLQGELSSPIDPKPSCRFASRCPYAKDVCRTSSPALNEVEPGHFVACHCLDETR